MKTSFVLFRDDSPPVSLLPLTERLFFSAGIFVLQVKPFDFLAKLYLPVVYTSGVTKIILLRTDQNDIHRHGHVHED